MFGLVLASSPSAPGLVRQPGGRFLTLLAIGFYVVVYTMLLKRSTPQNIVIGGAAGALPPVIGWAAVTGDIGAAGAAPVRDRLLLDAAALLGAVAAIRKDYAAAGVPMLPVVHGVPETTRQIAPLLGADGGAHAGVLRGRPHGPRLPGRGARARRPVPVPGLRPVARAAHPRRPRPPARSALYKYSISYLSLLFLAVADRRAGGDPGLRPGVRVLRRRPHGCPRRQCCARRTVSGSATAVDASRRTRGPDRLASDAPIHVGSPEPGQATHELARPRRPRRGRLGACRAPDQPARRRSLEDGLDREWAAQEIGDQAGRRPRPAEPQQSLRRRTRYQPASPVEPVSAELA